jgi:uncharacterized damage-inducible protein DinB
MVEVLVTNREAERLVVMLDEAYRGPAWHGPSLRSSLRGVTPEEAAWRPAPGQHNIWELVVHTAYWKYAVRRRLLGRAQDDFGEKGRDWFNREFTTSPEGSDKSGAKAWRRDLDLLARSHQELRRAALALRDRQLDRRSPGHRQTPRRMLAGTAMHDVYHAGQIRLLRRLVEKV